jgi:DUF1365 family protein
MFAIDLSMKSTMATSTSDVHQNDTTTGSVGITADSYSEQEEFNDMMWPLSYIVKLRSQDHLKNGEGLKPVGETTTSDLSSSATSSSNNSTTVLSLQQRVFNLVAERTGHKFVPTVDSHRVVLLTHLCYYGYNFNPVSFYYVVRRRSNRRRQKTTSTTTVKRTDDQKSATAPSTSDDDDHDAFDVQVDAVVGEVSNTPWTEMYCYVLHPESMDDVQVRVRDTSRSSSSTSKQRQAAAEEEEIEGTGTTAGGEEINYVFHKSFHVSPFMEMDYLYDWSFVSGRAGSARSTKAEEKVTPASASTTVSSSETPSPSSAVPFVGNAITVLNSLKRPSKSKHQQGTSSSSSTASGHQLAFRAKLELDCRPISPLTVAYQLIKFPIFCFIIQIWIHWEALWLFVKGIVYVPHPRGSETTASKIIATIMIPFFAMRDVVNPQSKTMVATGKKEN